MAAVKAPVQIKVEPLIVGQLDSVSKLQRQAMAAVWSAAQWQQVLAVRYLTRVAIVNDELIAAAVFSTVLDEAELETIFVHPGFRSNGVASTLLEVCFTDLPEKITKVFLEVDAENSTAIKLYERYSFTVINKRKGYYTHSQGNGDALIMQRQQ